jgi:uncharacterized protein YndB with AHSA1/START domain
MAHYLILALAVTCGSAACGRASNARAEKGAETLSMTQPIDLTVTRTSDVEITVRRRFAAPPSKVFEALTTPSQLRQWMSAAGRELIESDVDLRTGGRYRYVFKGPKGSTFGMYGTYREVVPGSRIVHTEAYDGYDWEPLVTTTDISEDAGGTVMVMTIRYPNKEICDTDFPNIESATGDGFKRLDKLLAAH